MWISRTGIVRGAAAASALIYLIASGGIVRADPSDRALPPGGPTLVRAADSLPAERPAYLQIINPADEARERRRDVPSTESTAVPTNAPLETRPMARPDEGPLSSELPPIVVIGRPPAELREEDLVGDYEQPRWTAETRRFPGTRLYVKPPGSAEFEFWLRPTVGRHGKTEIRSLYELELGLPHRLQLDLYLRTESVTDGPTQVGESIELRYALADWNKIWGNPTLYIEWSRLEDAPDAIEAKLLLGGEIAPRWHWGINLSDELNTGGARENEIQITGGVSYTLVDQKFSVGLETIDSVVDTHRHRGRFDEKSFFVGPSFQYHATERLTIDFAPLLGVTGESPRFQAYLVIGYEF